MLCLIQIMLVNSVTSPHLHFTKFLTQDTEWSMIDRHKTLQQQQQRQSAVEVLEGRGNQQKQSAVEGRSNQQRQSAEAFSRSNRLWHQQVCVVLSPPGKIRLALPAEFFKRGAATGVGSGGWGCRGGEEPASRARDASRATRRRRPSRWSPWRSSLSWAAGQLASMRTAHVRSRRAARLRADGPCS
ncbi:hypothetical protein ACQJBY_020176 [Aegilops geniculata]